MSNNKAELFQVNGYGDIASNNEAANIFYIFCFTDVKYKIQEDVESCGNKLESGEPVFNETYTYNGWHK